MDMAVSRRHIKGSTHAATQPYLHITTPTGELAGTWRYLAVRSRINNMATSDRHTNERSAAEVIQPSSLAPSARYLTPIGQKSMRLGARARGSDVGTVYGPQGSKEVFQHAIDAARQRAFEEVAHLQEESQGGGSLLAGPQQQQQQEAGAEGEHKDGAERADSEELPQQQQQQQQQQEAKEEEETEKGSSHASGETTGAAAEAEHTPLHTPILRRQSSMGAGNSAYKSPVGPSGSVPQTPGGPTTPAPAAGGLSNLESRIMSKICVVCTPSMRHNLSAAGILPASVLASCLGTTDAEAHAAAAAMPPPAQGKSGAAAAALSAAAHGIAMQSPLRHTGSNGGANGKTCMGGAKEHPQAHAKPPQHQQQQQEGGSGGNATNRPLNSQRSSRGGQRWSSSGGGPSNPGGTTSRGGSLRR
ncbi:hypothetical protein DUNSADRAFT_10583 [Dunaliella salina]|uniref:Encoded protein n=1 Tax=Dunaliella salina TaxID=3046 RepID=A0ABQ7H4U6_DUNSA|nr:hypothetical protein DUNSADRAFT_10583 [Dunaliella salina]|eukprot:KAF5841877.1 hypothetical protein DUNSADRAFT_10583 [Dunaliella salina]